MVNNLTTLIKKALDRAEKLKQSKEQASHNTHNLNNTGSL